MLHFARWKSILIWMTVFASILIALPNLFSTRQTNALADWFPVRRLALGLDLQGGSHLMLKVERSDVLAERLKANTEAIGTRLRGAGIGYTGLTGTGRRIQVRITDPAAVTRASDVLKALTVADGASGSGDLSSEAPDQGVLRFTISDTAIQNRIRSAVTQSVGVIERRIAGIGLTEPVIRRQGVDRLIVQVPGLGDPQQVKDLLGQPAKLTFNLLDSSVSVEDAVNNAPPANSDIVYSIDDPPTPFLVERRAILTGDNLISAVTTLDPDSSEPAVSYQLDPTGTDILAETTRQNIGRTLAVLLDGQVISTKAIDAPVSDGTGTIAGGFSDEGAADLSMLIQAGALPATLTVVEERTVGPGLGDDSIASGITAGIIGAGLVFLFMFAFYGFFGLIANVAVVLNVVMIVAILSLLGATLTLPGIAGIVLIIGMAVDANVLIYERIREEARAGRPLAEALSSGFSRALSTIIDANITTLIAALILFYLGSGPVRGFAVTLAIGIITTLFTAFTVTRWMMAGWFFRFRPSALPKGIRTGIFDGTSIRFMSFRRYTFMVTILLVVGTFGLLATTGLNFGVDFRGGSLVEVEARNGEADLEGIRARLGDLNLGEVVAERSGGPSNVIIRIASQDGGENAEQSAVVKVRDELEQDYEFRRVEVVGPSVSGDITWAATMAVLASLAAILVYIWARFEWQFAVGAIIATLHDILLTLGFFALTGFEVNLAGIAAVLTVVGYSLNDTVVIYDRIRENLKKYPKMPIGVLIDSSINSTLSRTVLTGTTTALALAALAIFGGEVIRSFTLAMLFGVVVGTFSSIYIAGPILILFRLRPNLSPSDGAHAERAAKGIA